MNTDIFSKLTSRKLWAAVLAFVATVLTAFYKEEIPPDAVSLIQSGVVALCVYIFGEAGVDIARMIWQHSSTSGGVTSGNGNQMNTENDAQTKPTEVLTSNTATGEKPTPREPETPGGNGEQDEQSEDPPNPNT